MTRRARTSQQGFTLVELVIAVAITAMGLVIAVPLLSHGSPGAAFAAAAQEIAADLRDARSEAIARNQPVSFRVDVAAGVFGHDEPRTLPRGGDIRLSLFTATDLRESRDSGSIRFFPDGSSTGGGVALNGNGRRVLVLVDWLSGKVSVDAP